VSGPLEEREISCPHCGEPQPIFIDTSGGSATYIEDCSVCCHPMEITISVSGDRIESVNVSATQ
jgi:hypothetical protein